MRSVVSHCDSISESLLSANHFDFFADAWRRPAVGGRRNRLWARTRTLVAAAAVAGLALPGTTHHCREDRRLLGRGADHVHSLCRKEWRFIGNSSPSWLTSTDSRSPGRLER